MELDELEVGDARARKPRQHHAVAGGNRRIGGFTKHLARAAGGQQHRSRMDLVRHVVGGEPGADAAAALDDQPDRAGVLLDRARAIVPPPAPTTRGRSRGRWRRPNAARAGGHARLHARAPARPSRLDRTARPTQSVHARSARRLQPARERPPRRRVHHPRPWCRRRVARACRRGQPRRQCRPAHSRCCSRRDWLWSGRARRPSGQDRRRREGPRCRCR